ncbi:MAG: tRNA pseudouridine(38-40) synthase TruA [Clostridia bacterium]|nr:tRNA pseudouridine(38-40) synthase TruA [Clostridia bacterium]
MRYAILVSYDGTDFCGWQVQPNKRTVQSVLEQALSKRLSQEIRLTASGRTDAGVHAYGQVCHFDAQTSIPAKKIADSVNPSLPSDVKILKSAQADDSFDANRTAKKKTYRYTFYRSERDDPMYERYGVRLPFVDLEKMKEGAALLVGEHDFKAFCASGSSVKTTVRTIYDASFTQEGNLLVFRITGNGFLYNMVRTLVGELVDIGRGRLTCADLESSFRTGSRQGIGKTMPARGLALECVNYDTLNW